jgi:hypothetical protein
MAYVMPHGVQLNFKATNKIFKADVRSFSVAAGWIKCRGICARGLPLDAFKQLSPPKR